MSFVEKFLNKIKPIFKTKRSTNINLFHKIKSLFAFIFLIPKTKYEDTGIAEYSLYKSYLKYKLFVFVCLILTILYCSGVNNFTNKSGDYIARISIVGTISDDEYGYGGIKFYEETIKKVINDSKAKAVIVYINSGGGQSVASQILYQNLLKLAHAKPTFCNISSIAASGGYMAALACKKIYSYDTSIIGSIGVRANFYDLTSMAEKLGIKVNILTSGELKAAGNPWKEFSIKDREYLLKLINSIHNFFVDLVAKERNIPVNLVAKIADGSIMQGIEAKQAHLIDEIGDMEGSVSELKALYKLDPDIKIVDIKNPTPDKSIKDYLNKFLGATVDSVIKMFAQKLITTNNQEEVVSKL